MLLNFLLSTFCLRKEEISKEMFKSALNHEMEMMKNEDEFMASHLRDEGYKVEKI